LQSIKFKHEKLWNNMHFYRFVCAINVTINVLCSCTQFVYENYIATYKLFTTHETTMVNQIKLRIDHILHCVNSITRTQLQTHNHPNQSKQNVTSLQIVWNATPKVYCSEGWHCSGVEDCMEVEKQHSNYIYILYTYTCSSTHPRRDDRS